MQRQELKTGTIIELNNVNYIVDSVCGDGATCIVYEAHYTDSIGLSHIVNIKECYPYSDNISRNGSTLIWESEEQHQKSISAFVSTYDNLMNSKLKNFAVHAFDIADANGTKYIIMDYNDGVTFDKDNPSSLSDILSTVKLLAYVVGQYHARGYLHLDIKPSNFLVYPRPSEHIILFDMDTVTAIEDINSGKVSCVSYSKGWAAPEQMQGKVSKLCPATDIYSIGAILFKKVMDRTVTPEDCGIFSDWDFSGELFENVNPKIKRLLRNIFKKTLAANIERRYQKVDTLLKDLDVAIETLRAGMPYLISDYPSPNANFIGRKDELLEIENCFKGKTHTIFLHGFGGIGKSELAKKYAEENKNFYDAILFLNYENSLKELINDIDVQNCEAEDEKSKINVLKKAFSKQKLLLIIDNFDVLPDEDGYLERFLRFNADIIFTTRTDFSEMTCESVKQVDIFELSTNDLVALFEKESGLQFNDELSKETIKRILNKIGNYTLLVPILARQLEASGCSLEALTQRIEVGLQSFENAEKVSLYKDGKLQIKSALNLMRATFRIFNLTDIQKQVLSNLYFLRFIKMNKEQYRKYFAAATEDITVHVDVINDLIRLNWIQTINKNLTKTDPEIVIHPIISEMIQAELCPDITQNYSFVEYINMYLPWFELKDELLDGLDDSNIIIDNVDKDKIKQKLLWFCAFANTLDFSIDSNLEYVVNILSKLINGNLFVYELVDYEYQSMVLFENLKGLLLSNRALNANLKFKIANLIEIKWILSLQELFFDIERKKECYKNAKKHFDIAHIAFNEMCNEDKEDAVWLLCKPAIQIIKEFPNKVTNELLDIYNCVKAYEPLFITKDVITKDIDLSGWDYNITEADDSYITEEEKSLNKIISEVENGKPSLKSTADIRELLLNAVEEHGKFDLFEIEKYYTNLYFSNFDISELSFKISNDEYLSSDEKNEIFYNILEKVIKRIASPWGDIVDLRKDIANIDCKRALQFLDYQEDFYCGAESFENLTDAAFYNDMCDVYRAVLNALSGNNENFEFYSNILIEDFKNNFERRKTARTYLSVTDFDDIRSIALFGGVIAWFFDYLRTIERYHLALPYLIDCTEYIHNWLKTREDYKETDMYNWYKTIVEFALEVSPEHDENKKWFRVLNHYQNKIDEMTEKDFELKS